ncbi:MAG: hypothetical protein WAZ21_02130 [Candidatus Saccharimonadales bacterium]
MDFLKVAKRRSLISGLVYNALNVALAIAVLIVVQTSGSPLPAFLLVLLSKWRVLAVRPRYWFAHIQANLVDFIVSIGIVILLNAANTKEGFWLQIIITVLYIAWLLFLKPRSKRSLVVAQAGVAAFIGVTALYIVSFAWPVSITVLLMWLIGYAVARHVLTAYDETHVLFLSLLWGFVFAEFGWLAYHWAIAYAIPGLAGIKIPQIAIILLAISFVVERGYESHARHKTVRMGDIILPLLLSVSIIALLLLRFNDAGIGS